MREKYRGGTVLGQSSSGSTRATMAALKLRTPVLTLSVLLAFAGVAQATAPSHLMPAPSSLKEACQTAATALRREGTAWRLTCPTEVPLTILPSFDVGGANLSSRSLRTGYLIDCLGLSRTGHVHWLIAGGSAASLDALVRPTDAAGRAEARVTSVKKLRIAGWPVTRYLIASGGMTLYSDHVVLTWMRGDEEYQVSVHRWPDTGIAGAEANAVAANIIRQQRP